MNCPFLDQSDAKCAGRLTLNKLDEALGLCLFRYQNCPLYQKKSPPHAAQATPSVPRLRLTG